jgi:hypothetical protein
MKERILAYTYIQKLVCTMEAKVGRHDVAGVLLVCYVVSGCSLDCYF